MYSESKLFISIYCIFGVIPTCTNIADVCDLLVVFPFSDPSFLPKYVLIWHDDI